MKNNQNHQKNQIVWKADNKGVKEETLTQTCRRRGDGQLGGEESWKDGGWWARWSHIHVWISREDQLGS